MGQSIGGIMSEAKPQVVIIAGPNGAGKSTLAPVLLRDTFSLLEFVNADTISAGLSAFNAEAVALDAGRVMLTRLRELANNQQSFAFESTLATRSYAPWIGFLAQEGYEFHLLFLWLNTAELAVQRVAERVRNGGHSVSEDIIRRRYSRGLDNLSELYMPLADTWVVYDNSGTASPLLIASGEKQRTSTIARPDLWQNVVGHKQ
jgi:predicted ABC-type ATPase